MWSCQGRGVQPQDGHGRAAGGSAVQFDILLYEGAVTVTLGVTNVVRSRDEVVQPQNWAWTHYRWGSGADCYTVILFHSNVG
jgi:hypothetical protein